MGNTFKFADTGAAATATTVTWNVNTGGGHSLSAGDLVILYAILGDPSMTFSTAGTDLSPSGFTALINDYDGAHNGAYMHVSWKIAVGGETSFTSATAARSVQGEWAMVVYSGTTATPIDGNSLALSGSANATMTALSVSPVGATDTLIAFASATDGGSAGSTNFAGMTSRVATGGSGGFTNQTQIYIADLVLSASGATGVKTAIQTTTSFYYSGLVAIQAAASGGAAASYANMTMMGVG